jgi:hypothetical protein
MLERITTLVNSDIPTADTQAPLVTYTTFASYPLTTTSTARRTEVNSPRTSSPDGLMGSRLEHQRTKENIVRLERWT